MIGFVSVGSLPQMVAIVRAGSGMPSGPPIWVAGAPAVSWCLRRCNSRELAQKQNSQDWTWIAVWARESRHCKWQLSPLYGTAGLEGDFNEERSLSRSSVRNLGLLRSVNVGS